MAKATAIATIINNIISELADYELTTTTTARTSHGRTTSTSTTAIRHKPQQVKKAEKEEPWLVQPKGWEPHVGRRTDGLRELWGAPRVSKHGEIEVPVRLMDGDLTTREYTLALTATVKGNLETCRRMATAALIKGSSPYLTTDIYRAARLLSYHAWENHWEELRKEINELMYELNAIAELSTSARKAARKQGRQQLCADYGTSEEDLRRQAGLWKR